MPEDRQRTRRPGIDTGLRTAVVWASVSAVVALRSESLARPLRVLDLGGGSGGVAVPLAVAGHTVTVVDPSPDALASLQRRAGETDAGPRVTALQGDSDTLDAVVGAARFDLVCCHGTLEYVDNPAATLARLAAALDPGGHLSLVTAQRYAGVLGRALAGRFAQASAMLEASDGRWGEDDPAPRRFDRAAVVGLIEAAGLHPVEVQGVRIFTDLAPSASVESEADRAALLDLERLAARHPALGELGGAVHVLATTG